MKKLYLSDSNRKIAGVCSGIAEYFDLDPTIARLGTVLTCLLTGFFPVLIAYVVAWAIVPRRPVP